MVKMHIRINWLQQMTQLLMHLKETCNCYRIETFIKVFLNRVFTGKQTEQLMETF